MKILIVSSFLPYPLYSGGQVRLYNLIKELEGIHEITLICEIRTNQTLNDIEQIKKICHKVITVTRRKQWSLQNLFQTAVSKHSFLTIGHTNKFLKQQIEHELNTGHFDLIHVETFYVAQNIPATKIPVVIIDHNIEYQVYSRFAAIAPFFLKPFLNLDINKIKNDEINTWKNASIVVAVSQEDKKTMLEAGINAYIVPNGVNTSQFSAKKLDKDFNIHEKKILFIGDFKWIQNRDTLNWIIKEIWPLIINVNNSKDNLKLWIIGRNIPQSVKSYIKDRNILLDDKSSNKQAWELFRESYITLSPIRVGGGTSYKILESMSCGTPVIMTTLSAKSLGVNNGKEGMVGDTPAEIARNTTKLLNDFELYKKISKNGRLFIEKNYTWTSIARKLNEIYLSTLKT